MKKILLATSLSIVLMASCAGPDKKQENIADNAAKEVNTVQANEEQTIVENSEECVNDVVIIEETHHVDPAVPDSHFCEISLQMDMPAGNNDAATQKICRAITKGALNRENDSFPEACRLYCDSVVNNYMCSTDADYVPNYTRWYSVWGYGSFGKDSIYNYVIDETLSHSDAGRAAVFSGVSNIFHFNPETGEETGLNDMLKENYKNELVSILETMLLKEMDFDESLYRNNGYFPIDKHYLINENHITFVFVYYYMGHNTIEINLPYERIKHLMK